VCDYQMNSSERYFLRGIVKDDAKMDKTKWVIISTAKAIEQYSHGRRFVLILYLVNLRSEKCRQRLHHVNWTAKQDLLLSCSAALCDDFSRDLKNVAMATSSCRT